MKMNKDSAEFNPFVPEDPAKGFITKSRHTPGLRNARDVCLQIGDEVTYRLLSGDTVKVTITSTLKRHINGAYGYEGVFANTATLGFADELRIIDWKGKT